MAKKQTTPSDELTEAEHKEYMRAFNIQKIISEYWTAQQQWERSHKTSEWLEGVLYQKLARLNLEDLYNEFQDGDEKAILEAMYICMLHKLLLPLWCKNAFLSACSKVYTYKAKSWDDVFGRPHLKGTHLSAKREEREKALKVCQRIMQIKKDDPKRAIDGYLFETVGREFAIGSKTKTEKWYYKHKDEV